MCEADGLIHCSSFQQRRHQRTVKGISRRNGIDGFNLKARHAAAFAIGTYPHPAATKGDNHGADAFIMQCTRGSRSIVIIFYADARQLFGLSFVRRNDVHQRQQLV